MKKAIVEILGKQYLVGKEDVILVDKINKQKVAIFDKFKSPVELLIAKQHIPRIHIHIFLFILCATRRILP